MKTEFLWWYQVDDLFIQGMLMGNHQVGKSFHNPWIMTQVGLSLKYKPKGHEASQ